jgi:GT2 family glycosyltransferase
MSGPEIVFAFAPGQNAFFRELAEALCFELERLGAACRVAVDDFPCPSERSVVVLLPPHEFVHLSGVSLTPAVLRRCLLISAEQPTSGFFPRNVELGRDAGAVLDINRRAVRAYREAGIAADHLQLGYSEAWDGRNGVCQRDIDILFLGRVTERRERALADYADLLERFECEFILSDDRTPNPTAGANFATKESKLRLLARSKVLLNIHGEDEPYFEWLRAVEAISSGCVVVSEHSTDLEPLRAGTDVVTGSLDSLGLLAAWMVDDGERRSQVAIEAEKRLRSEAPLAAGAARLLEAAERVASLPIAPQAGAQAQAARAKLAITSLLDDKPLAPRPVVEDDTPSAAKRVLRVLKRQQQELLYLRRRLASEELARKRPERPGAATVEEVSTSAWRQNARATVSTIVPLYNGADTVLETLDSVRDSTMGAWELVVVDDGSGDDGNAVVRGWMDRHPALPIALVRHEINRGLSAARNTGAEIARGDLLLMLDADNLIRPYGMARLRAALVGDPGADFSYGILDRFGLHERTGVISKFGWEPSRFREENYIDALALIRRRAFFELGGYSEDPRLALGLEDYDLWARMAEAGRRGAFVRNFVGSYRAGHSSMLSVTGISSADAIAAISEHAPNLMRGVEPSAL